MGLLSCEPQGGDERAGTKVRTLQDINQDRKGETLWMDRKIKKV